MMDEREALAPCPICGTPDPWTGSAGGQLIVACSNTDTCPEASCDWALDEWEERTRAAAALRTQAWEQGRNAAAAWVDRQSYALSRDRTADGIRALTQRDPAGDMPCDQCGRPICVDTVVDKETWEKISPTGDSGGQLCASCMVERLAPLLGWAAARLVDAHHRRAGGVSRQEVSGDPKTSKA